MKSLIFKKTSIVGDTERISLYILGIRIYVAERSFEIEKKSRPVGFVQFYSDAHIEVEDEDYFPKE